MNYECKRFDKLDFIKMKNSTLGKSLLKKNEKKNGQRITYQQGNLYMENVRIYLRES